MVGSPFAKWVEEQMVKRNEKIKAEQDMLIDMDPEIAEIFRSSQAVSGKYLYPPSICEFSEPTIFDLTCLCSA